MQTGYYNNIANYKNARLVSISGDKGRSVNFDGETFSALAPKYEFWKKWHEQIGKLSEEENMRFYIEHYYSEVLSKLDAAQIYNKLKDAIVLCYETPDTFCHRHIVACWLERCLGLKIDEALFEKDEKYSAQKNQVNKMLSEVIDKDSICLS